MPSATAKGRPGPRRRGPGRWFADRRVRTKILLVVAVTSLATTTVGLVGLVAATSLNGGTRDVASRAAALQHLAEAQRVATSLRADLRDHILSTGDAVAPFQAAITRDDEQLAAALARFASTPGYTAADRAAVEQFRTRFGAYQRLRDEKVIPASTAGDKATAYRALTGDVVPVYKAAMAQLADLMAQEVARSASVRAHADDDYRTARLTLATLVACGLAVPLVLALAVTRTIVAPLRAVQGVLVAVAAGDLTHDADVVQGDELGEMARALRTATDGIRGPVQAMASCARTMEQAAVDLAAVNGEITSMAERTSARAESMAATAQQVSGNILQVASGAEEMGTSIGQIARDAAVAAQIGGTAVRRARDASVTVADLGDASTRIGQVLGLITSIAEQTNLLALNATIEAARAGEAGKGFAVVAGEVKDLAGETARATGDIEDKVKAIETGTAGAVSAITGVTGDMEQINEHQTSIAAAVEEQATTSAEITRNVARAAAGSGDMAAHVAEIADAARSTSAGVQRNQQAAERLSAMSAELREIVGHFRY